jgi:DNA-binding response OmpR family regulator
MVHAMSENGFTETESKMLSVLADGMPHRREELHACLWDEAGRLSNICIHISKLRKKLRPKGQHIVCEFINRRTHYRQIRLLQAE